ncbi:SURF1 family protein [Tessaracoccus sp. Y1736]
MRAKQAVAVTAGLVVAAVMLTLGLWQMSSYEESTRDVSAERAALEPVALAESVAESGEIDDVYGRQVTLTGAYTTDEVLVGEQWPLRVVTAFEMDDGRHVAVVRGIVEQGAVAPAAPSGEQDVAGVFLSSDLPAESVAVGADIGSLRVQALAQGWPSPLIGGYVTLPAEASTAQGLSAAPLVLPEAEGSATHRGYALQWWVFAAGAVAFGIYVARGFGKDAADAKRLASADEVQQPLPEEGRPLAAP